MSFPTITPTWSLEARAKRAPLVVRLFKAVQNEFRLRRAIRQVSELDERTLVDIGLTPGGTESAVRRGRGR